MATRIRIDISDEDAIRQLDRLAEHLTDMTPLMQDLGEYLADSTERRFPEGVAPDGTPWAPKSQATMDAYRRREGRSSNASVPFRPLYGPSGRLSSEIHYEAQADSVEIGSNLIYAAVMQMGAGKGAFGTASNNTPIPWGDIPARPFLGISEDDRQTIPLIVAEYLTNATEN